MRVSQMFPSQWLSGLDLDKDYTLTMNGLVLETIGQPGKQEEKYILSFKEAKKRLVLNVTNATSIARLYGDESDNWMGQKVTLYAASVNAFGKTHQAVRVREVVNTVSAAPDPVTPAQADDVPTDEDSDLFNLDSLSGMQGSPRNREVLEAVKEMNPDPPRDSDLTPNEIDLIESWKRPVSAQIWALEAGACENEHEARNSWKKITGDKAIKPNELQHYAIEFYKRQRDKLVERKGDSM